ncbi:MAG: hypothetical protein QOC72_3950 [Methylobacteriaceae bacterium]|nr:hypothetical protein [Methylobacteriaceae bacterium]
MTTPDDMSSIVFTVSQAPQYPLEGYGVATLATLPIGSRHQVSSIRVRYFKNWRTVRIAFVTYLPQVGPRIRTPAM